MAKEDNLTGKCSFVDKKLASAAGKKSGEVRRQRKQLKELIIECLVSKAPQGQIEKLQAFFPDIPKDANNLLGMAHRAMVEAHNGDVKAFKTLCELAGMLEQNINITKDDDVLDDDIMKQIEKEKANKNE